MSAAPKDGTHVLVFDGGMNVASFFGSYWYAIAGGDWAVDDNGELVTLKPLGWMPLPEWSRPALSRPTTKES